MKEAAKRISRAFGVPISYEDPPWLWVDDSIPWIDTPEALGNPSARSRANANFRVPRPGSLEMQLPIDWAKDRNESATQAATAAVSQHTTQGNPGRFSIVTLSNFGMSIVPIQARNSTGSLVDVHSPLDARISFPESERKAFETLQLIGSLASAASPGSKIQVDVTAGGLPFPPLEQGVITVGAQNEVARDVLARALRETNYGPKDVGVAKLSWNLLYDISTKTYKLSFSTVTRDLISTGPGIVHGADDMPQEVVRWAPRK
jgi:hypothetical protein